MAIYVKAHLRGNSAVKAYVRTSSDSLRSTRKINFKGHRYERAQNLRDKLSSKLYASINQDFRRSHSGFASGRTKLLKKMMIVMHKSNY